MENPSHQDAYYSQLPVPETTQMVANPGPNDPSWNTPAAIGVWLLSVIFILVLPNLVVLPYLLSRQVSLSDSKQLIEFLQSDPTAVLLSLGAIIPAHILTIAVAWAVVTRFKRFPFLKTLGWTWGPMRWWHYVLILASFFALAAVLGHFLPEQENDLLRILRSSRFAVYLLAFLATFTAPFVEEVIYRGVLYSAFRRTFGPVASVVLVTLLFSLVHVPQYYPSWLTIILLTVLSLILTLIRARTASLLPCIVLHFLFNGIQSLGLILGPYLDQLNPGSSDTQAAILHLLK